MTPYEINEAVMDYLAENWTRSPGIKLPNDDENQAVPHIAPQGLFGQKISIEIPGPNHSAAAIRAGVYKINVFTKKGSGEKPGFSYSSTLESIFRNVRIGPLYFAAGDLEPWTTGGSMDDDLEAYKHTVNIPFTVIS